MKKKNVDKSKIMNIKMNNNNKKRKTNSQNYYKQRERKNIYLYRENKIKNEALLKKKKKIFY